MMEEKYIRIFVLLGVLCCLLTGCKGEDPLYRVYKENGEWYMEIPREIECPESYVHQCVYGELPSEYDADVPILFRSVLEMKRTVESGALPVEYLYEVQQKYPGTVLQIVDLDALYEPVFPREIKEPDTVSMDLSVCEYALEGKGSKTRGVLELRYGLPRPVASEGKEVKYQVVLNENTADKSAREVILEEKGVNVTGESPELYYRLVTEKNNYLVKEVSRKVMIFAEWEGVSMYVSLEGLQGYPTLEWISQFGIKPLEGERNP